MPLLTRKPKKEETLFVARETVYLTGSPNVLRPCVARGEVVTADSSRLKNHPEAFEPAPTGVWRGSEPKPHEAAAIAQTPFIASDGAWVMHGRRFHPYDQLVRAHAEFFAVECPRE